MGDRESAYWVLLYVAMRYLKNKIHPSTPSKSLQILFYERYVDDNGVEKGGWDKTNLPLRDYRDHFPFNILELANMFNELADGLSAPYLEYPREITLRAYQLVLAKLGEDAARTGILNGGYLNAQEILADPCWFMNTLRKHAVLIPLLSRPSFGDTDLQRMSTVYDLREPSKNYQGRITSSWVRGLAGELVQPSAQSLK